MCGIYGFDLSPNANISKARKATLLTALAIANEDRGSQSWGAYLPERGEHGLIKRTGSILDDQTGIDIGDLVKSRIGIVHTRFATRGALTAANAHPFDLGDGWVGQHNGVVGNYSTLDKMYGEEPVDSIHLLKAVVGTNRIPLHEINVYGSVQVVPPTRDAIYLGRMNGGQLCIVEIPRVGIVFTSDEDHMKVALRLAGLADRAVYHTAKEGALYVTVQGTIQVHDHEGLVTGSYNRVSYGTWQSAGASRPASSYTVPRSSVYGGYDGYEDERDDAAWWQGEIRSAVRDIEGRKASAATLVPEPEDDDALVLSSECEAVYEAWEALVEIENIGVRAMNSEQLDEANNLLNSTLRKLDVAEAFAMQENDVEAYEAIEEVREHLLDLQEDVKAGIEAAEWEASLPTRVSVPALR